MTRALETALRDGSEDLACREALRLVVGRAFRTGREGVLRAVARTRAGAPDLLVAVDDTFRAIQANGSAAADDYWRAAGNVQVLLHAVEQAVARPGAELPRLRLAMHAVGRAAARGAAGAAADGWRDALPRLRAGDRAWLAQALADADPDRRFGVLACAWLRAKDVYPVDAADPALAAWREVAHGQRLDPWLAALLEALWRGAGSELYRASLRMAARVGHADVLLAVAAERLAGGGWRGGTEVSGSARRAGNALTAGGPPDADGWADVPRAPVVTASPLALALDGVLGEYPLPETRRPWTAKRLAALLVASAAGSEG